MKSYLTELTSPLRKHRQKSVTVFSGEFGYSLGVLSMELRLWRHSFNKAHLKKKVKTCIWLKIHLCSSIPHTHLFLNVPKALKTLSFIQAAEDQSSVAWSNFVGAGPDETRHLKIHAWVPREVPWHLSSSCWSVHKAVLLPLAWQCFPFSVNATSFSHPELRQHLQHTSALHHLLPGPLPQVFTHLLTDVQLLPSWRTSPKLHFSGIFPTE